MNMTVSPPQTVALLLSSEPKANSQLVIPRHTHASRQYPVPVASTESRSDGGQEQKDREQDETWNGAREGNLGTVKNEAKNRDEAGEESGNF